MATDLIARGMAANAGGGGGDSRTFQPFPNGQITGTLADVVTAIMAFPNKGEGKAYLGSIAGSCTPFNGNGEVTVTFMTDNIAVISLSSSNVPPYHWEYNTAQNNYVWRSFMVAPAATPAFDPTKNYRLELRPNQGNNAYEPVWIEVDANSSVLLVQNNNQ